VAQAGQTAEFLSKTNGRPEVLCDRIIARLGALPPRGFVEACGVVFPSDDPAAVPAVSPRYESNVRASTSSARWAATR
jgi:hypothetical protein